MNNKFMHLLTEDQVPTNNEALVAKVNHRIKLYTLRRRVVFGSLSILSFLATIPSAYYAYNLWAESDFVSYASLLISDSRYVFGNISDYVFSIVNSAPISSTILVLGALCIFVASLRKFVTASQFVARPHYNFAN